RVEETKAGRLGVRGLLLGQPGKELPQLRQDLSDLAGAATELPPHGSLISLAYICAQRLRPRPVCRGAARLPAAAGENGGPPCRCGRQQLLGQPALADPRLALDEEEAATAGKGVLEPGGELGQFRLTPDEGRPIV